VLKIGVISDTHWSSLAQANAGAQRLLHSVFADVDAIIHAGDMLHPDVDLAFAPYEFYAVRGNMDAACAYTPLKRILNLGGLNIGVIHGWGAGAEIEANAAREFDLHEIDMLIYGHSHFPACHVCDDVLFFNPGSATERRRASYHSVGLIRIGPIGSDPGPDCERDSDINKLEIEAIVHETEWEAEARQILCCGKQQVSANIINIDAVSEIV